MREVPDEAPRSGIAALKLKLAAIRGQQPEFEHGMITEVVRAVLTTISDDLTTKEATLLREVEELGRTIAIAKSEIAALRVDDITDHDIPFATDELDAIVEHTAHATHAILESCEMLDEVSAVGQRRCGNETSGRRRHGSTRPAAFKTSPANGSPRLSRH